MHAAIFITNKFYRELAEWLFRLYGRNAVPSPRSSAVVITTMNAQRDESAVGQSEHRAKIVHPFTRLRASLSHSRVKPVWSDIARLLDRLGREII